MLQVEQVLKRPYLLRPPSFHSSGLLTTSLFAAQRPHQVGTGGFEGVEAYPDEGYQQGQASGQGEDPPGKAGAVSKIEVSTLLTG
jgi:hypothetical protein